MSQDGKIYCLQARPYSFQSWNFTGWGSERVNSFISFPAHLSFGLRCANYGLIGLVVLAADCTLSATASQFLICICLLRFDLGIEKPGARPNLSFRDHQKYSKVTRVVPESLESFSDLLSYHKASWIILRSLESSKVTRSTADCPRDLQVVPFSSEACRLSIALGCEANTTADSYSVHKQRKGRHDLSACSVNDPGKDGERASERHCPASK